MLSKNANKFKGSSLSSRKCGRLCTMILNTNINTVLNYFCEF